MTYFVYTNLLYLIIGIFQFLRMKNAIGEQTKMRFIAFVAVVEVRGASFVQAEKCFSDGWTDKFSYEDACSHLIPAQIQK